MAYIVYQITCAVTSKSYIGITRRRIQDRWSDHCEAATNGRKTRIAAAIRKYGVENFQIEHIASARTVDDLLALERALIAQEETVSRGYNVSIGGDGPNGLTHSAESRAKMRQSHLGKKRDPEAVRKTAAANRGRKFPPRDPAWSAKIGAKAKGRKRSSEATEAARQKLLGRKFTPEWRAKISAAKKGKGLSAEQARLHSERMRGRKKPPRTEQHRAALAEAKRAWWAARKAAGYSQPRDPATGRLIPMK